MSPWQRAAKMTARASPAGRRAQRANGTTTVRITPTAGSVCSLLLQPPGGAFPALPCGFSYRLRGTRLEEPLW